MLSLKFGFRCKLMTSILWEDQRNILCSYRQDKVRWAALLEGKFWNRERSKYTGIYKGKPLERGSPDLKWNLKEAARGHIACIRKEGWFPDWYAELSNSPYLRNLQHSQVNTFKLFHPFSHSSCVIIKHYGSQPFSSHAKSKIKRSIFQY